MALLVNQERRQEHEDEDLQEFRLPVLEGRLSPPPDVAVRAECLRRLSVLLLLGSELRPSHPGLEPPAHDKQADQRDAQAIVTPDAGHMPLLAATGEFLGRYSKRRTADPRSWLADPNGTAGVPTPPVPGATPAAIESVVN